MNLLRQIPNILTLSNLLAGSLAILLLCNQNVEFRTILLLFGWCLLADILDGAIARKLGVSDTLGIQLDSLADVVSFGMVPALIISRFSIPFPEVNTFYILCQILAACVAVSAGLRLGRFNVDERPREYFWGLATPAGAILVMALAWDKYVINSGAFFNAPLLTIALPIFLIIMYQVPLKLPGLKSPMQGKLAAGVLILMTIVLWFLIGPLSIAVGMVGYVLVGILNLFLKFY